MNLETISMPKEEAQAQFEIYRDSVRRRHNDEDHAIMTAYKTIMKNTPVISLTVALQAGGWDERGWPKIAVMRANEKWCWLETTQAGAVRFRAERWLQGRNMFRRVEFPEGTFPYDEKRKYSGSGWRAMVPIVPPNLRPKFKISNYHVLWEATWEQDPAPPIDPALLKHIGGDLYAVLAIWDLTPIERLVLAGRKSSW